MGDVDLKQAQFDYELALGGISTVAIAAVVELTAAREQLPRWRWLRRLALDVAADAMFELADRAAEHQREQEEASDAVR